LTQDFFDGSADDRKVLGTIGGALGQALTDEVDGGGGYGSFVERFEIQGIIKNFVEDFFVVLALDGLLAGE
jgi:hypothetical protein